MFADRVDAVDPTHRLLTRQQAGDKDWGESGWITAENRAIAVFLSYGTAVRLCLEPAHSQFETVERELTRVPETERVLVGPDREYEASLPDDRALVDSILDVPAGDTDAWADRTFSLAEFAVLDGHSWLYRSVPHETHIREINATDHEELPQKVNDRLEQVSGSAVVRSTGSSR